ncbi:MAG TPA: ABC transporter substrate-binding protein [Acetobacteraceae bacterium]|nr:ABC transporter substrate-binding protein [Acetobacteraceae bacterium]
MRSLFAVAAAVFWVFAFSASAQPVAPTDEGPIKLGAILDMGGLYADVTGPGSETAARMAIQDFGGKLLGRPIQFMVADHQNKPDIAASIASKWFDSEGMTAIMDVAASSPALAVMNVADQRHKIVMLSGPGALAITNKNCTPTTVHWVYNTYGNAHTVGRAILRQGGKTWFFITADYTFGHALEADTSAVVKAAGGKVLGDAKAPLDTADFSSMLIIAQQSGADVIGLANGGNDTINAVKQASEFGISRGKQKIALLGANINDVHGMGLDIAQNLLVADAFYWDTDDATRAFAKRFYEKLHKMPNMLQAGLYSAVNHYLHAVQDAGTTDFAAVMQKMRDTPVNDFFTKNGHVRSDGMMVHDMHLFQVKTPAESKGDWDLYKLVSTVPADEAFQPLSQSQCPLVKH